MNFINSNAELLLVHKNMKYITNAKKYDLVLTPQFYIFKKEELPVKYKYQALRLAPSILDGLTGDGNYSYEAIKEDDGWILIAYDMNLVATFLKEKGLPQNHIGKIYFSQQLRDKLKRPVSIDDNYAMTLIDNTVTMVPKTLIESDKIDTMTDAYRPAKGTISPQESSSFLTMKQTLLIATLLTLLSIGYLAEGIRYKQAISSLDEKIDAGKNKYPKLQGRSKMVLDNLYESGHKIDSTQRKVRDILSSISQLTSKNTKIDHLKINIKEYKAALSTDSKNRNTLKKNIKTKKMAFKEKNGQIIISGGL